MHQKNILLLIIFIYSCGFLCSCKKFLQIDPPSTQIVSEVVFENDQSAEAAILGVYSRIMSSSGFASGAQFSITNLAGLTADELINYAQVTQPFYENSIPSNDVSTNDYLWSEPYQYIYTVNAVLEGLEKSKGINSGVKSRLSGEAKFIRAFSYFYLENLFGPVPLDLTTDSRQNASTFRSTASAVYSQIIKDLKDAEQSLPDDYSLYNGEKVRPVKTTATAFLARVYLYMGDWIQAESHATVVISNTSLYSLEPDLDKVFLKNSSEAIWQLQPVIPGYNTWEGNLFILTGEPTISSLSENVYNRFEANDNRKTFWVRDTSIGVIKYHYAHKYKVQAAQDVTEYSMVFRLSEQYLIRSEARAKQGNLSGATDDLNAIRRRAGLGDTPALSVEDLLTAIDQERAVELFTEWGHRWFDLKRRGMADEVLSTVKGAGWRAVDTLFPIPITEIQNNPHISQNPGY